MWYLLYLLLTGQLSPNWPIIRTSMNGNCILKWDKIQMTVEVDRYCFVLKPIFRWPTYDANFWGAIHWPKGCRNLINIYQINFTFQFVWFYFFLKGSAMCLATQDCLQMHLPDNQQNIPRCLQYLFFLFYLFILKMSCNWLINQLAVKTEDFLCASVPGAIE